MLRFITGRDVRAISIDLSRKHLGSSPVVEWMTLNREVGSLVSFQSHKYANLHVIFIFSRRFILRAILRRWLLENFNSAFRFLWCDDATSSKFSGKTPAASMRATSTSSWTFRASVISKHCSAACDAVRCSRTLFWSGRSWLIRRDWYKYVLLGCVKMNFYFNCTENLSFYH